MKLGLKEIGVVATLATVGCAVDKPTTAISRRQYEPFPDVITEETVKAVRTACATANVQEQNMLTPASPPEIHGDSGYAYLKFAEHAGKRVEEKCLALHGLTPEGDITDTMPTDQSPKSDIEADGGRRGESTFKIDGLEFGGGGFTSEI